MATKTKRKTTKDAVRPRAFTACTYGGNCGKASVATVGGVDVSAEAKCLPHWVLAHGLYELKSPVVFA